MERKCHAIIILGILYNNSIVDRNFLGKKRKDVPRKRKGEQLRRGRKIKGQGKGKGRWEKGSQRKGKDN